MKNKVNWFIKLIIFLFIIFVCIFIINKNGFYEAKIKQDTIITNDNIKRFENDLKNNKVIDIDNYLNIEEKNYQNKINNTGEKLSESVNKLLTNGFKNIWEVIKILFI